MRVAARRRAALALLVLPTILVGACDKANMAAQDKAQTWDESTFFADRASMRPTVPGTVARDAPDVPAPQPPAITTALLARGRERFDIFCSPCHGASGDGRGMIVQRGFPPPPPLTLPRLRQASAASLYAVITDGHGVMYGYADRVASADRWATIAYIRALQQSQDAPVAGLSPEDIAKLAETTP